MVYQQLPPCVRDLLPQYLTTQGISAGSYIGVNSAFCDEILSCKDWFGVETTREITFITEKELRIIYLTSLFLVVNEVLLARKKI